MIRTRIDQKIQKNYNKKWEFSQFANIFWQDFDSD